MPLETHLAGENAMDREAWDQFVRSSEDGTVFHLFAWRRVVESIFKHKPYYLQAIENGAIRAVLPLFEVWGLLAGHVLISVPYGTYGGLCGADPAARSLLLKEAKLLAERRGARYVELRQLVDPTPGLPTTTFFDTFVKRIDAGPEASLASIPRKRRAMIRQGINNGLQVQQGWDNLPAFYEIYLKNRRRLGSPPFSFHYFESLRKQLGAEAHLLTVWHKRRAVAGLISFLYQDRVMPYYSAALPETFSLAVNDFMYWELMRETSIAGYRLFDFGQSHSGSGTYAFKRNWGFEPRPMSYQYLLKNGASIPEVGPSSRQRPFVSAWKRLPLFATKWIGPILIQRLPLH